MNTKELLDELMARNRRIVAKVRDPFLHLPDSQLRQRPAPKKWSVNEIFTHLNVNFADYFDHLREGLSGQLPAANPEFRPGPIGGFLVRSLKAKGGKVRRPIPTIPRYDPTKKQVQRDEIAAFILLMEELETLMQKARTTDLNEIRIPFAVFPAVRLKLGDVFRLLIAHAERHIIQAENTLKAIGNQSGT